MESTETLANDADGSRSFPDRSAGTSSNRKALGAHLYFIKIAKGRGPVKIGRANDPLVRLATLQVGSPYTLKLLGVLDGQGPDEFEFHHVLQASRLRGEWFKWTVTVEQMVKAALAGEDWRKLVPAKRHTSPMDGDWFYGSPLYAARESAA